MSAKVSRTHTPVDPADANVMDLFRMDGMVAVVTGAGRGIGRGIALAFADAGATVVLTARRVQAARGGVKRSPSCLRRLT